MRIAFLADLHANLPALQAVIADLPAPDRIVCCGDLVGYYPDAAEVCAWVRGSGALVVRGNHEAYVTQRVEPDPRVEAVCRSRWTREQLDRDTLAWLAALPAELELTHDGMTVRVRHASPWDEVTYLHPSSPRLAAIELGAGELLVVGHTHRPMLRQAGRGRLLNPGSVGQPRDGDPRPGYALLDTVTGEVELRRVPYDVAGLQRRLRTLGYEPEVIDALTRKR